MIINIIDNPFYQAISSLGDPFIIPGCFIPLLSGLTKGIYIYSYIRSKVIMPAMILLVPSFCMHVIHVFTCIPEDKAHTCLHLFVCMK